MKHVQTLAITLTRQAAQALTQAVEATPDARLAWQPLDQGRSILQQVIDCAIANLKWALVLESRTYSRLPRAFGEVAEMTLTNREAAVGRLQETVSQLTAAIDSLTDDEIGRVLSVPAEDGVDLTMAEACLSAYWNMVHHEGQIRYIQTLYGDMTLQNAYLESIITA